MTSNPKSKTFAKRKSAEKRSWAFPWKKKNDNQPNMLQNTLHLADAETLSKENEQISSSNQRKLSPWTRILHIRRRREPVRAVEEMLRNSPPHNHFCDNAFVIRNVVKFLQLRYILENRAVNVFWKAVISLPVNRETDTFDVPEHEATHDDGKEHDENDDAKSVKGNVQSPPVIYGYPRTPRQILDAPVDTSRSEWWLLHMFELTFGKEFSCGPEDEDDCAETLERFVAWVDLQLRVVWRHWKFDKAYAYVPRLQQYYYWLVGQVYGCLDRPLLIEEMPLQIVAGQIKNIETNNDLLAEFTPVPKPFGPELLGGSLISSSPRNNVDHIVNGLWIGNAECLASIHECNKLGVQGITHVVSCYQRDFIETVSWMRVHYVGLYDTLGTNVLETLVPAFRFMEFALAHKQQVLVHCHRGKSRSASIVIGYLMWKFGFRLEEAMILTKTKRNNVFPNLSFQAQLLILDGYLTSHRQILTPYLLHSHIKQIRKRTMHKHMFVFLWHKINQIDALIGTLQAMTQEERSYLPSDGIWGDEIGFCKGVYFGFDVRTQSVKYDELMLAFFGMTTTSMLQMLEFWREICASVMSDKRQILVRLVGTGRPDCGWFDLAKLNSLWPCPLMKHVDLFSMKFALNVFNYQCANPPVPTNYV